MGNEELWYSLTRWCFRESENVFQTLKRNDQEFGFLTDNVTAIKQQMPHTEPITQLMMSAFWSGQSWSTWASQLNLHGNFQGKQCGVTQSERGLCGEHSSPCKGTSCDLPLSLRGCRGTWATRDLKENDLPQVKTPQRSHIINNQHTSLPTCVGNTHH